MTCCAGVVDEVEACVWMAADSMLTLASGRKALDAVKIDRTLGCLYGASGDPYMMQVVAESLSQLVTARGLIDLTVAPDAPVQISQRALGGALRANLRGSGWAPRVEGGEAPFWDVGLLLTDGRGLYHFDSAMYPRPVRRYHAIGTGALAAFGAASVLATLEVSGLSFAWSMVAAAIDHDLWSGGTPHVIACAPSAYVELTRDD